MGHWRVFTILCLFWAAVALPPVVKLVCISAQPRGYEGIAGSFSGFFEIAWELNAAVVLAAKHVNEQNLLPGHQLVVELRDDSFAPHITTEETAKAIDPLRTANPARAVLGLPHHNLATAASHAARFFHVPVVTDFVSSSALSDKVQFPTLSRLAPSNLFEGMALAALIKEIGWSRVATFTTVDEAPMGFTEAFMQACEKYGIEVVISMQVEALYSLDEPSESWTRTARARLEAIRQSGARIIILSAFLADAAHILRVAAMEEMLQDPYVWVGTSYWLISERIISRINEFAGSGSKALDGFIGLTRPFDSNSAETQAFEKAWEEEYQKDPESMFGRPSPTLSYARYDSVMALVRALKDVKATEEFCASPEGQALVANNASGNVPMPDPIVVFFPLRAQPHLDLLQQQYTPHGGCSIARVLTAIYNVYYYFRPISQLDMCCLLASDHTQGVLLTFFLRKLNFVGASGHVMFEQNGDLRGSFRIVNMVDGKVEIRGTVSLNGTTMSSAFGVTVNITSPFVWGDGSTDLPLDRPVEIHQIVSLSENLRAVAAISHFCMFGLIFFLLLFNVLKRNHPLIKLSSPNINSVALLGAAMMNLFGLANTTDSIEGYGQGRWCQSKAWLLPLGFTLLFGSLFSKVYRVHRIFNTKKLSVQKIKDQLLLAHVGGLLFVDLVILTVWTIESPLQVVQKAVGTRTDPDDPDRLIVELEETCDSEHSNTYIQVICLYKAVILTMGAWLAWQIRGVKYHGLNDSREVGFCIYVVAMISVFTVPTAMIVDKINLSVGLVSGGIIGGLLTVMGLLFVPKVFAVYPKLGEKCGFTPHEEVQMVSPEVPSHNVQRSSHLRPSRYQVSKSPTPGQHPRTSEELVRQVHQLQEEVSRLRRKLSSLQHQPPQSEQQQQQPSAVEIPNLVVHSSATN